MPVATTRVLGLSVSSRPAFFSCRGAAEAGQVSAIQPLRSWNREARESNPVPRRCQTERRAVIDQGCFQPDLKVREKALSHPPGFYFFLSLPPSSFSLLFLQLALLSLESVARAPVLTSVTTLFAFGSASPSSCSFSFCLFVAASPAVLRLTTFVRFVSLCFSFAPRALSFSLCGLASQMGKPRCFPGSAISKRMQWAPRQFLFFFSFPTFCRPMD